jgi:general L-amino acid transport system substrate-binding protein
MTVRVLVLAAATAIASIVHGISAFAQIDSHSGVLDRALKRGVLACGVSGELQGFAQVDDAGEWRGLDVDFCRALAAAVFDDPTKMKVVPIAAKERVAALQSGAIDVLARGAPWTQARDAGLRLLYAAVTFHDGQGFLTRKKKALNTPSDLVGASICAQRGTSFELDLSEFFGARKLTYEPKLFDSLEDAAKAYDAGQCAALSADASQLYLMRSKLEAPAEHVVMPEFVSKAPHGPVVRQGDDQWFNIVRWTHYAMVDAEELGVGAKNVDEALKSENPEIRRLLGVDGDHGEGLGLSADWAYRIVKHVGNYGETFDRNLGQGSPLGVERRLDALWSKGGLMYAPSVR